MNTHRLLIPTFLAATIGVAIPQAANADTVTIEAVETTKGKQTALHRFSVELAADQRTEVNWNSRDIAVEVGLLALKSKAASKPSLSYKIRVSSGSRRLELESVVGLEIGKRRVIGRVDGKGRRLELAMTITK